MGEEIGINLRAAAANNDDKLRASETCKGAQIDCVLASNERPQWREKDEPIQLTRSLRMPQNVIIHFPLACVFECVSV